MGEYSVEQAREALDNMDDFARMAEVDPIGPRRVLEGFIEQHAALLERQAQWHPDGSDAPQPPEVQL